MHDTGPASGSLSVDPHGVVGVGWPSGSENECNASVSIGLDGMALDNIIFEGYESSPSSCSQVDGWDFRFRHDVSACEAEQDAAASYTPVYGPDSEAPCDGDSELREINWGMQPVGPGRLAPDNHALSECGSGACACEPESCSGSCTLTWDPGGFQCVQGGPIRAAVYAHHRSTNADCSSDQSECQPGSGRFALLPFKRGDNDEDGLHHATFLPIQTSGSGVMTRLASVSSVSKVSTSPSATLRALTTRSSFTFSNADALEDAATISKVVQSQTTFSADELPGNPVFVVEEVSEADLDAFVVDMTWTCGTGTTATRPTGYQFRLTDIGCTHPQKMTMRYATNPKRVYLEQYGNPGFYKVEPTATTTDGEAFAFDFGGLSIDGVVLSATSEQARVRIDSILWNGVSQCTTGTYTFARE